MNGNVVDVGFYDYLCAAVPLTKHSHWYAPALILGAWGKKQPSAAS
jgi:hypothetical protein